MAEIGDDLLPELQEVLDQLRIALIDGLEDLQRTTVSDALKRKIEEQLTALHNFRSLVEAVIGDIGQLHLDLTALRNAGYPELPRVALSSELRAELDEEVRHLRAGAGIFLDDALATSLEITLDPPQPQGD